VGVPSSALGPGQAEQQACLQGKLLELGFSHDAALSHAFKLLKTWPIKEITDRDIQALAGRVAHDPEVYHLEHVGVSCSNQHADRLSMTGPREVPADASWNRPRWMPSTRPSTASCACPIH
jgi:hypothetical protein